MNRISASIESDDLEFLVKNSFNKLRIKSNSRPTPKLELSMKWRTGGRA